MPAHRSRPTAPAAAPAARPAKPCSRTTPARARRRRVTAGARGDQGKRGQTFGAWGATAKRIKGRTERGRTQAIPAMCTNGFTRSHKSTSKAAARASRKETHPSSESLAGVRRYLASCPTPRSLPPPPTCCAWRWRWKKWPTPCSKRCTPSCGPPAPALTSVCCARCVAANPSWCRRWCCNWRWCWRCY